MSMMIIATLYTNLQLQKTSGAMSKVVEILGMNQRIRVGVDGIVIWIRIARSLILFLCQRIMLPVLLRAPLSLTTIQVLIFCLDVHLHNQKNIFSLVMLTISRPITHTLLLRLHHRNSLHLQIILKREIYLDRDLNLSPSANTIANNGLKQFGNE